MFEGEENCKNEKKEESIKGSAQLHFKYLTVEGSRVLPVDYWNLRFPRKQTCTVPCAGMQIYIVKIHGQIRVFIPSGGG